MGSPTRVIGDDGRTGGPANTGAVLQFSAVADVVEGDLNGKAWLDDFAEGQHLVIDVRR